MNNYQVLCVLYKLVKDEDHQKLLEYASKSKYFQGMSFQTVIEMRYNEATLAADLSRPQQLLLKLPTRNQDIKP